MKLNATNRRRALQRRRKLMPEPRRIRATDNVSTETRVVGEVPSTRIHNPERLNLEHARDPEPEPGAVQNQA